MTTFRAIIRAVEAHTEVNKRTGIVRAVVSDDSNDRFNTVFDPEGCNWAGWEQAGAVVCYNHGKASRGLLPVGNAVEIDRTTFKGRRSIVMDTKFWDTDDFAEQIGDAYRSLKMRGWSVHARSLEASPPTRQERNARADWAACQTVYRSWELLEVSCCEIPGNVNTVTTQVLRSLAGPGTTPAMQQLDTILRTAADTGIVRAKLIVRDMAAIGMSNTEILDEIARLKLELELGTLQSAVDRQRERARLKIEYARPIV